MCPNDYNIGDSDRDGIDDACDTNIYDGPLGDPDGDGIPNNQDSCPNDYNKGTDYDNDGIDDACDPPPPEYALTLGLYDDFDGMGCEQTYDGSQMAIAGSLSDQLWRHLASEDVSVVDLSTIVNDSISYGANPSGNIVRLNHTDRGDIRLEVINPEKINFVDYQSFSADVMLKDTGAEELTCGLDYHTSIPEQPPGISWWSQIRIGKFSNGWVYIAGQYKNKNTDETQWVDTEAKLNTWYNLRMDIVKISDSQIRIDYFINDELLGSLEPNDSEILLDPSRLAFGPIRSIQLVGKDLSSQNSINANIDNVNAVFENRTQ